MKIQYTFSNSYFVTLNGFYGIKECSASVDTTITPYSTCEFHASQKKNGLILGLGKEWKIKKIVFSTGVSIPLIFPGNFNSSHHHKAYNASACGWSIDYTSRSTFQGEACYGFGISGGITYNLTNHFSLGADLSWYYLFSHLKASDKPETTVDLNCGSQDPGDPVITFDKKFRQFSIPGVALNIAYSF